eukprot:PRCOL_00005857-RA
MGGPEAAGAEAVRAALAARAGGGPLELSGVRLRGAGRALAEAARGLAASESPPLAAGLAGCGLTDAEADGVAALYALPLRSLNLMGNELTALPDVAVGSAMTEHITLLGLKSNKLNALPSTIGFLTSLTALFLTDNALTELPAQIGQLSSLRKLQASSNKLRSLPREVARLKELELLRVPVNAIESEDRVSDALFAPCLRWLSLASNPAFETPRYAHDALRALPVCDLEGGATGDLRLEAGERALNDPEFGGASGGDVLRARYAGEPVALKLFAAADGGHVSPDGAAADEMALVAGLGDECPHAPRALARVRADERGRQGLVLRLVEGRPLAKKPLDSIKVLRCRYGQDETFTEAWAHRVASGVAAGASHMEARSIAHGDIYAHNVLVSDDGSATLIDLGAAFGYDSQTSAGAAVRAAETRALALLVCELAERVPPAQRGNAHAAMVRAAEKGMRDGRVCSVRDALAF